MTVIGAQDVKVPVYCACENQMQYFNFTSIRPFDFSQSYNFQWADTHPMVMVSIEGAANPLMVGMRHPHQPLLGNERYFNLTGKQDINSLMHASCGSEPSKVTLRFTKAVQNFLLVVYGVGPKTGFSMQAYDASNAPVYMNNWETIDQGLLTAAAKPITMDNHPGSLHLGGSSSSQSYIMMKPTLDVRTIELSVSNKCDDCSSVSLFYALIAIGNCTTTPSKGPYTIGDNIFVDTNGDGVRGPNEAGYPGVTVQLLNQAGQVVDMTTTDGNGNYHFSGLPEGGVYSVNIVPPKGTTVSPIGTNNVFGPDGKSPLITLTPTTPGMIDGGNGQYILPTIDGGLKPNLFAITGHMCLDNNGNGIKEPGEGSMANVIVNLLGMQGNIIANTTTDMNGNYKFEGLPSGFYHVSFVLPEGGYRWTSGKDSLVDANGNIRNIQLTVNNGQLVVVNPPNSLNAALVSPNNNACVTKFPGPNPTTVTLTGFAFTDTDKNGNFGNGDIGLPGVSGQIVDETGKVYPFVTGANGEYSIPNLPVGRYCIFMNKPGFVPTIPGSQEGMGNQLDPTGKHCFEIPATTPPGSTVNILGGFVPTITPAGSISGFGFEDTGLDGSSTNDPRIPGLNVALFKDGKPFGTTTTGPNGDYSFPNIAPGVYCVIITDPAGRVPTTAQGPPATGNSLDPTGAKCFEVKEGETTNVNGGFKPKVPSTDTSSVSGQAWFDFNGNGVRDPAADMVSADFPLKDILVSLYKDGVKVNETLTGDGGKYEFKNLAAGQYCVEMKEPTRMLQPTNPGINSVIDKDGKKCFIVPPKTDVKDVDGGFIKPATPPPGNSSISGETWIDLNGNGIREPGIDLVPGDDPLPGVTVLLFKDGVKVGETTTGPNGKYEFKGLAPGRYCIEMKDAAGKVSTIPSAASVIDKDGKTCFDVPDKTNVVGVNGGFTTPKEPPKDTSSVSGETWRDLNGNGIREPGFDLVPGDDPLPDVTVSLFKDGVKVNETLTGPNGKYEFKDLAAGQYCVEMRDNIGKRIPTIPSAASVINKEGKICFDVPAKTNVQNVNGGFVTPSVEPPKPSSISGSTWTDKNADGLRSPTDDKPLAGVTVILTKDGVFIDQKTTGSNGQYDFRDLKPGQYCVEMKDAAGKVPTSKGAASLINEQGKHCFDVPADTEVKDINGGFKEKPKFTASGNAWKDLNGDGIKSPTDDKPLKGIKVTLTKVGDDAFKKEETTDVNGDYKFPDLAPGTYCVEMSDPADLVLPTQKITDSKITADGKHCFEVKDQNVDKIDGGFKDKPADAKYKVTGEAWKDKNNNGNRDGGEVTIPDITVTLTKDGDTEFKKDIKTRPDGTYAFDELEPGRYCVEMKDVKGDVIPTVVGTNNKLNDNGKQCFDIVDKNIDKIDAGFKDKPPPKPSSVSGSAFTDTNGDGTKDPNDDKPLKDITVTLTKEFETTPTGTTTTKPDGTYEFKNVKPGRYCVEMKDATGKVIPTTPGTNSDINENGKHCFDVPVDKDVKDIDGGFKQPPKFAASGNAWKDLNGDGIKTPTDDKPLKGIKVTLTKEGDTEFKKEATTDENGDYKFPDLAPGTYCVTMKDQADLVLPTQKITDSTITADGKRCFDIKDQNVDKLDGGFKDKPADAKYKVTGEAWKDKNNNGNRDGGEVTIPDITVTLTKDGDTEFKKDIKTRPDGTYEFDELEPGRYCVEMKDAKGDVIPTVVGTNNKLNDNGKQCFDIVDKNIYKIDAGFKDNKYSASGNAWKDKNADGTKSPTDDKPLKDVTVTLTKDGETTALNEIKTDANGNYKFPDLKPGKYCVTMKAADAAMLPTTLGTDSGINTNGKRCFDIEDKNVDKLDGGFKDKPPPKPSSVSGSAFTDTNGDGTKDPNDDKSLKDITVTLTKVGETTPTGTTTTKPDGTYEFKNVKPGRYCVEMKDATGKVIPTTQGTNSVINENGKHCFDVPADKDVKDIDGGFKQPPKFAASGNAWKDLNGDGIK
eukprot:gene12169-14243_t